MNSDALPNEPPEDDCRMLVDDFMADLFTGTNSTTAPAAPAPSPAQIQLPPLSLSLAALHDGSAPATPAASSVFGGPSAAHALPPLNQTQSAPPPRLLAAPHVFSEPLVLPPARLAPPATPPPGHLLGASPITPALASTPRSAPPHVQSAPVTPAQVPVSPLSPSLEQCVDERFEPSLLLARQMLLRLASEDSTDLYKSVVIEIDAFVDRLKNKVRDGLRESSEKDKSSLSPKQRTRLRSRRGAAVSRFRVSRKMIALEEAAQWCVAHIGVPQAVPPPPSLPPPSLPGLALGMGGQWRGTGPGTMSPRYMLANNLTALTLRTPPARTSAAPHTPPAMNLPPANTAPTSLAEGADGDGTDDALLSSVTKMPVSSSCDGAVFQLSYALQTDMLNRRTTAQVDQMMRRLKIELNMYVDMRKGQVRDEYKSRLNEIGDKLTAKARMRGRSRRGAAVTRFKHAATIRAWENALSWLVSKVGTSHTDKV